jgi:hypothetical protein
VDKTRNEYVIYTAGEEKLIRVFDEPLVVMKSLQLLSDFQYFNKNKHDTNNNKHFEYEFDNEDFNQRIEQAYIPELGLSNKALTTMTTNEKKEQESRRVLNMQLNLPPLESQLTDFTIWPGFLFIIIMHVRLKWVPRNF